MSVPYRPCPFPKKNGHYWPFLTGNGQGTGPTRRTHITPGQRTDYTPFPTGNGQGTDQPAPHLRTVPRSPVPPPLKAGKGTDWSRGTDKTTGEDCTMAKTGEEMDLNVRSSRRKNGSALSDVLLPQPLRVVQKGVGEVEVPRVRIKTTPGGKRWISSFLVGQEWVDIAMFEVEKSFKPSLANSLSPAVSASVRAIARNWEEAGTMTTDDDLRDTCQHCPASGEGCEARRLFAGARCCSRCSHA